MAAKQSTDKKTPKALYCEVRAEIPYPSSESAFYAALSIITACGFRHSAAPGVMTVRMPGNSLESVESALMDLATELKRAGYQISTYTLSEVFVDSGSFDTLQILETPPHADKPK